MSDVSFEVAQGEKIILLGTSGCGKTTLLKMINRLIEPTSGSVFLNGENIQNIKPEHLRKGIGYVLQNNGLFPHYTIEENIAVVPRMLKWDSKKIEQRTFNLLEKLHLDRHYLNAYPAELSGGQQQRVGLARALAADPPVLLMDEPFGALDTITRTKIQAEFKNLDELKRKTVIMVTHDVQEAFELSDRVCLMDKGSIIQMGTPSELLFNPSNKFAVDFLKEQNLLLQFKAVKLLQIVPVPEFGAYNLGSINLDVDADVWQVLELFKQHNVDLLTVTDQHNQQVNTLSFADLMAAFYQHVKTYRHE
ncbi:ABC transporter ATP-binding protein [Mucilaginibacter auburnensis]|uniref:ABC transporter ATP-binding protein n=1 Tax=Mucilaginibacter auburnensis TaxID=1457233 RepID=UPI001FE9554C|nr:ABC transporter ATP-binding protein [Mucilaginibacter auburnensis]